MRCAEMEEMISAYANGELAQEPREQVEQHLSGCVDCQEKLTEYLHIRKQLELLRETPDGPDIKVSMMSRIKSAGIPEKPSKAWGKRVLIVIPVAAILAVLLIMQPWVPFIAPESVLARAYSALESLTSYRISISGKDNPESTKNVFETAFVAPDRYYIKQSKDGEDQEFILIGSERYYKGSYNSLFVMQLQMNSFSSMVTRQATLAWMDMLRDIQELPEETIEGVPCFHYQGIYDIEKRLRSQNEERSQKMGIPPLSEEQLKERLEEYRMEIGSQSIELWIGKDDYLVRQMEMNTQNPANNGGLGSSQTIYKFSDFNQPIVIEAPLDSGGKLLPDWASTVPEQPAFETEMKVDIDNYDPQNRRITYAVNLHNVSGEKLTGVDVKAIPVFNPYKGSNLGLSITRDPSGPEPYTLAPGDSLNYKINFSYDATSIPPDQIVESIENSSLYIAYVITDGQHKVEMVHFEVPDSIYTLPANQPSIRNLTPVGEYRIEEPGASSAGQGISGEIDGKKYLFVVVNTQNSGIQAEPGILVLDIQNPAKPAKVSYLQSPENTKYLGTMVLSGKTLCVSAEGSLWIIDVTVPGDPKELGRFSEVHPGFTAVSGNYLYVSEISQKISTIDLSNPSHPRVIGSMEMPSRSSIRLDIVDGYLLAWASETLHTIDVSSPESLKIVNSYAFSLPTDAADPSLRISPAYIISKAIVGSYTYIALGGDGADGMCVLDISDPANPVEIAYLGLINRQMAGDLFTFENRAFLSTRGANDFLRTRLEFIDISNPAHPVESGFGRLPDYWTFFEKASGGSSSGSYSLIENYLYWFIGTESNQPVIEIFDLSGL